MNKLKVFDEFNRHEFGNPECKKCLDIFMPMVCKCGGIIHSEIIDDGNEGPEYWRLCDNCGGDYEL
jgi:hypothetical protein